MLVFGQSLQRARKDYQCDLCGHLICEGSKYERYVWMPGKGIVHVMRHHYEPECPEPEGFEENVVEDSNMVQFLLAA